MARITREQAQAAKDQIDPMVRHLGLMKNRLEARGYTRNDMLLQFTEVSYDGLRALSMELHYVAVGRGVGRNRDAS